MANVQDKFRSLAEGLYLASASGQIKWSAFVGSDSYVTPVGRNKIEISSSLNDSGEDLYVVNIYDGDGNRVDGFTDEYFSRKLEPQHVSVASYFWLMSNLFEMARRNATGADKVLDDLLLQIKAPSIDSDVPF